MKNLQNGNFPRNEAEWSGALNATESLAGKLRDRLRFLANAANGEKGNSDNSECASWWESVRERIDNDACEADKISDTLASIDCDSRGFNG